MKVNKPGGSMKEVEVIDSRAERARLVERTDVLDRVKALATLPGYGEATTAQVAEFYDVTLNNVRLVVTRNRREFDEHGYHVLRGETLRKLVRRESVTGTLTAKTTSLAVFTRAAVLLVGMLLEDSPVAAAVRSYLLNAEAVLHETVVEAVTVEQSSISEFAGLGAAITAAVSEFLEPRLKALDDRMAALEQPKAIEAGPIGRGLLPSTTALADEMNVPESMYGECLVHGYAYDGKPWAAYGFGRNRMWIDRRKVLRAYKALQARAA